MPEHGGFIWRRVLIENILDHIFMRFSGNFLIVHKTNSKFFGFSCYNFFM